MKLIPLASSSHGNAYLVEDGTTCLLIECGVSWKKLQKLTGFGVSGIAGCLISHEHKDHAGCYEQLIRSGVPVYASRGTAEALGCEQLEPLEDREVVTLGSFDILPFPTFHDAAEPMGFLIRSRTDGDKLVFATDTVNLDKLIDGQGVAGFTIYFYLCQRAFGLHGYFLPWTCDDAASVARRIGGGVGSKAVQDTVGLCLRIGLFDRMLYEGHGVLTSRGIQRSFVPALKKTPGKVCHIGTREHL